MEPFVASTLHKHLKDQANEALYVLEKQKHSFITRIAFWIILLAE